jgi:hypothetical protein
MSDKLKAIIVRAVVTAFEAALGVLIAAGTTNLDVEVYQGALAAGIAAALSVLYNAAKSYLAALDSADPLPPVPTSDVM